MVGPVQIVEDQRQRLPLRRGLKEAHKAVEQPEPGLLWLQRRGRWQIRQALPDVGDDMGDVDGPLSQV